jgi:DNA modification methylase
MIIQCKYDQLINVDDLKPYPKNRNKHSKEQIERLAQILIFQGIRAPIVVSKLSNCIVKGHGTLEAIKKNSWLKAPVVYQEFNSEEQEYAFVQSDNAIASWSELDLSGINSDLGDLGPDFDIDLLGIKDFTIDVADKDPGCDEDEVPTPKEAKSVLGDIYILGNHRLMCGDSTAIDAVEKLMDGNKADMVFTDPPYGMSAVSKSGVLSKNYHSDIMNDDNVNVAKDAYRLCAGLGIEKLVFWGANYYSSALPDATCWLVWDKNNGQSDQMDCELAWTNFKGVTRQFTKASEKSNRVHPTQKPVELIQWCFERWEAGQVIDLFGGSGSTLIACEKTNRKCFMMELDPHYCDVIVSRFCKYTKTNKVIRNGEEIEWVI